MTAALTLSSAGHGQSRRRPPLSDVPLRVIERGNPGASPFVALPRPQAQLPLRSLRRKLQKSTLLFDPRVPLERKFTSIKQIGRRMAAGHDLGRSEHAAVGARQIRVRKK